MFARMSRMVRELDQAFRGAQDAAEKLKASGGVTQGSRTAQVTQGANGKKKGAAAPSTQLARPA